MKRCAVAVMCMLALAVTSAFAQEMPVPSEIKEVILFTDQALVQVEAQAKVGQGLQQLSLDVRAFNIDKDSVQATVFGDGEVYSVQCKEINLPEAPTEQIKALENKLEGLDKTKSSYNNEADVLQKKEAYLSSLIDFAKVQVPQDMKTVFPKPEDLEKTLNFLGTNYAGINKDKEALADKIKAIDKEIDVARRDLDMLQNRSHKVKRAVEILFNSKKEQEMRIQASYLVSNAGWQPYYKVDVPPDLKGVDLTMFAKITQVSGEDWKNVKLTLSNVLPLHSAELPSLSSWILDVQRRVMSNRFAYDKAMESAAALKGVRLAASTAVDGAQVLEEQKQAEFVQAASTELPISFEYAFPQPVNIESQDKETILPVFSKDLTGNFYYYAVPKVNARSFLACRVSSAKEILAAPMSVYFSGRFVGKTYVSEKKPGEEFEINLGADRDVIIKREKVKDKSQETFFGKIERLTVIRELGFKITVENLKDKPVKLKLIDSIPVSKTDKIEVKDVKLAPEPAKTGYQDKEGVMLWETELKPKEKKEISIEFTVTYPKDLPVEF